MIILKCSIAIIKERLDVLLVQLPPHSLALNCVSIFSSFTASAMLPLILNFPDMKAMVGFSLPKKRNRIIRKRKGTGEKKHWYHIVVSSSYFATTFYCNSSKHLGKIIRDVQKRSSTDWLDAFWSYALKISIATEQSSRHFYYKITDSQSDLCWKGT